jgi:ribosomal protein S24E
MDFSIVHEEKRPLLHRRDVTVRIAFENATPSRKDITKLAAEKLKAKEDMVLVAKVTPEIGTSAARVQLRVYDDEAALKAVEYNYTLARHGLAEKKKKVRRQKK